MLLKGKQMLNSFTDLRLAWLLQQTQLLWEKCADYVVVLSL